MFYILCLFNIITGFVIFDFMDKMYGRKYEKKLYIFVYFIFIGLHLAVNLMYVPIFNMCFEITIVNLISYSLYQSYAKKYIYNLVFEVYLMVVDVVTIPIYSFITSFSFRDTLLSEKGMFISGMAGYFIIICTYRLLISRFKKLEINAISIRQDLFFILLAFFEIVVVFYLGWLEMESTGVILILITLGFLTLDLYIIYLLEYVSRHNILEHEMALSEQQAMIMHRNIHDLEHQYESSQKIIHDIRNYILTLKGLYEHNDSKLLEKYTNQLTKKLNKMEARFRCDNKILTILINEKILLTEMKEIEFLLEIQNVNWNFILEIDLTTLFANLLDNAIEACEEIKNGNKYIKLRIAELNNHIVLNITNTFVVDKINKKGNKYVSTKKGHYGIGLGNVKNVVYKYNGHMMIEIQEDVFMVKIIIPINEDESIIN